MAKYEDLQTPITGRTDKFANLANRVTARTDKFLRPGMRAARTKCDKFAGSVNVKASDTMKRFTLNVKVHGLRRLQVRLWVALRLIRFAARIAGCGIRVESNTEEPV